VNSFTATTPIGIAITVAQGVRAAVVNAAVVVTSG
jgi:hypothetical protein